MCVTVTEKGVVKIAWMFHLARRPDPTEMTLGERIRWARRDCRLTQAELAYRLDIATGTLQQYELEKRRPGLDMLEAIAEETCVPIQWIVGAADDAERDPLSGRESRLLATFNQLNDEGQRVAIERVEELTELPKYQKTEKDEPESEDKPESPD